MAAKKSAPKKKATGDLIISKSRTKAAAKKCNVGSEFYGALDHAVRGLIAAAEGRAVGRLGVHATDRAPGPPLVGVSGVR